MMNKERLEAEQNVLRRKLPENAYRFMDMDSSKPYLVMAAKTNRGRIYSIFYTRKNHEIIRDSTSYYLLL